MPTAASISTAIRWLDRIAVEIDEIDDLPPPLTPISKAFSGGKGLSVDASGGPGGRFFTS